MADQPTPSAEAPPPAAANGTPSLPRSSPAAGAPCKIISIKSHDAGNWQQNMSAAAAAGGTPLGTSPGKGPSPLGGHHPALTNNSNNSSSSSSSHGAAGTAGQHPSSSSSQARPRHSITSRDGAHSPLAAALLAQQLQQVNLAAGPAAAAGAATGGLSEAFQSLHRTTSSTSVASCLTEGGTHVVSSRHCRFVIGVAGGTASGKTTFCESIIQRLHDQCVVMLNQDSFYRPLSPEEAANVADFNFDHPDAFDTPLLLECIHKLKAGCAVEVPVYDFTTHSRSRETRRVSPADVIIVEGILVLAVEEVRAQCNMKIYVDTEDDTRLARRLQRDIVGRGRTIDSVLRQYTRFVKPAHDAWVAPSRKQADLIVPWASSHNLVAVDLTAEHIRLKLRQHPLLRVYPNLHLLPSNYQIRGMHTIIRDAATSKNDFVFYADRLIRLVVEAGLGYLPFEERAVTTPTGYPYVGVAFTSGICGVSIIRSGEAMETALRECCQGIKIGKILVHRHGSAEAEEEVVYERLPGDIAERYVLLLDPVLGTGRTAGRAIQVVLDKGVPQERILFLCLLAAPEALAALASTYPGVKVLTSEIEDCLDEACRVVPGVGEFGDRYFCE